LAQGVPRPVRRAQAPRKRVKAASDDQLALDLGR
jgi:hypothetical protein